MKPQLFGLFSQRWSRATRRWEKCKCHKKTRIEREGTAQPCTQSSPSRGATAPEDARRASTAPVVRAAWAGKSNQRGQRLGSSKKATGAVVVVLCCCCCTAPRLCCRRFLKSPTSCATEKPVFPTSQLFWLFSQRRSRATHRWEKCRCHKKTRIERGGTAQPCTQSSPPTPPPFAATPPPGKPCESQSSAGFRDPRAADPSTGNTSSTAGSAAYGRQYFASTSADYRKGKRTANARTLSF